MGKKLGNDYMAWIETATPGQFVVIRGQQGMTINRSAGSVDLSTKDDGGYGSSAPGLRSLSVDLTLLPNLPDTGYTRLETLANAATPAPLNIQIRKGGLAGLSADAVFAGSVYANLDSTGFDQNAGTPVKVTFTGNGAPTIDTLG